MFKKEIVSLLLGNVFFKSSNNSFIDKYVRKKVGDLFDNHIELYYNTYYNFNIVWIKKSKSNSCKSEVGKFYSFCS